MIENAATLGTLVRRRRLELGLSQRDLALAVNTGERFVVNLEAGKPTCQLGKALVVARAVGIELVDRRELENSGQSADERQPDVPDVGGTAR
jgi:HTH-type transcriptional regulator/antitoxin HipB